MMRTTFWLLTLLLLTACGSKSSDVELTAEEMAAEAAMNNYKALYRGYYEAFLDSRLHADEMPESYREAMLTNLKQHVRQVESCHHGVKDIEISHTQMDTTLHMMQVFLLVSYGDTTKEEIVVPMVEIDGEWKLK